MKAIHGGIGPGQAVHPSKPTCSFPVAGFSTSTRENNPNLAQYVTPGPMDTLLLL
jgi:hypothetical protein